MALKLQLHQKQMQKLILAPALQQAINQILLKLPRNWIFL